MTADREVLRTRLIDAMAKAYHPNHTGKNTRLVCDCYDTAEAMLDAVLALRSPCQTCGGDRVALQFGATKPGDESSCRACDGSGVSSVPVLVEYLMEQVGWGQRVEVYEPAYFPWLVRHRRLSDHDGKWRPVWVYKENAE